MNEQELNAKIADVEKTLNELKQELIKSQKPKAVPKCGEIVISKSIAYEHEIIHFLPPTLDMLAKVPCLTPGGRLKQNFIMDTNNPVDNIHYTDHKVLTPTQVSKVYDFIVGLVKDQ